MNDPDVKTALQVRRAIPQDGSERSYIAIMALHSLVWELWKLRDQVKGC